MFSHVYTPVRYRVGSIEIAVISDGYMKLDAGAVMGLIPRVMWEPILGRENIDAEHRMKLSLNCMIVRSGDEVLLVDTGLGNKLTGATRDRAYPGEYGHLLEGLSTLGLTPEDVTAVAVEHRYAGRSDAAEHLAHRVRAGSAGVWGAIPMPAQGLPDADLWAITQWIAGGAGK